MVVRIVTDTPEEQARYLLPLHQRWGTQEYGLELRDGAPSTIVVYKDDVAASLLDLVDTPATPPAPVDTPVAPVAAQEPVEVIPAAVLPHVEVGAPALSLVDEVPNRVDELVRSLGRAEEPVAATARAKAEPKKRASRGRS